MLEWIKQKRDKLLCAPSTNQNSQTLSGTDKSYICNATKSVKSENIWETLDVPLTIYKAIKGFKRGQCKKHTEGPDHYVPAVPLSI